MVLTVSFVLAPETGLFVSVTGAARQHRHQFDISVGISVARFPQFVLYSRPHPHELRKAKGNCNF
jgi:hypothetical protein